MHTVFFLKQGSVFRRKMMTPFLALSDFVQAPAPLCDKALLLKVLKGASASLEWLRYRISFEEK